MGIKSSLDEIKRSPREIETKEENLLKYINPELKLKDVKFKILAPNKENTPILATFRSAEEKGQVMQKRKQIGKIVSNKCHMTGSQLIYLNDDLPKETRELCLAARSLTEYGYQFIWVKKGKIFARKRENDPVVRIKCMEDVKKIRQDAWVG
ncbi:uncharacterized protein LOC126749653 [Anthonomus grandis grandis]|uniref:uncharacterized protein LOC126749653 n=1 Tax=Anthonomus grandis grandis TaxID=2921223 RepID=UPI002165223E|nr:uncharacterized protein LOC126749653 [Anthonomus grandis grandis]